MRKLKSASNIFFILLIFYLIINIIYLVWKYVSPEGIWSFWLFIDVLRIAFICLILVITLLAFVFIFFNSMGETFKNGFNVKTFYTLSLAFIVLIISVGLNVLFGLGPSMFITNSMTQKYSYVNRSEKLISQGEYKEALQEAESAYRKMEEGKLEIHPFFFLAHFAKKKGYILNSQAEEKYAIVVNYAFCHFNIRNNLEKAKLLYEESIELVNEEFKKNQEEFKIFPLIQLADIYIQKRNYQEAETLFQEIKALGNNAKEDQFYLYYFIIHANYALKKGDLITASQIMTDAYDFYLASNLPQKTSDFRNIAISAANSQLVLNDFERAGEILSSILPQMNKRKDRAEYLLFLKVRSMYCFGAYQLGSGNKEVLNRGKLSKLIDWVNPKWEIRQAFLEKSFSDLEELRSLIEIKEGKNSQSFTSLLITEATYYEQLGKFQNAQQNYMQVKSILKNFQQTDDETLIKVNLGLARISVHFDEENKIIPELEEVESKSFDLIQNNFPFLSEEEREKFILNYNYRFNLINSIYTLSFNNVPSSKIYDNIVTLKGIALSSNIRFRNLLQSNSQSLLNEYLTIQKEKEIYKDIPLADSTTLKKKSQIDIIEKEFINKVHQTFNLDLVDVSKNIAKKVTDSLSESEVAIEIFNIPTSKNFKDSIVYYGAILKKEYETPKILRLFAQHELDSVLKVSGGFANQINKIYGAQKEKLTNLFWSNLLPEVHEKQRVYLSVSGALHGISIPSLLIDEPIDLILLSSTKNILNLKYGTENRLAKGSVFGDPDFSTQSYQEFVQLKSTGQESNNTRGNTFERLPYTREEALSISSILEKNGDIKIKTFLEDAASEENLRSHSGDNTNLLHIATHGFFLNNQLQNLTGYNNQDSQNPLLNSGLILASSLDTEQSNSVKDGVITALDISKLDFSNTDLVVLSACETGLGVELGGEGVFGLQRAFKIAGAKSVMVSLWKVPDAQTSLLMTEFYENLTSGFSPESSLKAAQMKIREQFPEPFYWAGFILISD